MKEQIFKCLFSPPYFLEGGGGGGGGGQRILNLFSLPNKRKWKYI